MRFKEARQELSLSNSNLDYYIVFRFRGPTSHSFRRVGGSSTAPWRSSKKRRLYLSTLQASVKSAVVIICSFKSCMDFGWMNGSRGYPCGNQGAMPV